MRIFGKLADWLKYERLHHYPALAGFDKAEALKRLQAYEQEERGKCREWLIVADIVAAVLMAFAFLLGLIGLIPRIAVHFSFVTIITLGWLMRYVMHRRIRRRVETKVGVELGDGRLWTCIECGYDLRASEERCPECGASVRVQ